MHRYVAHIFAYAPAMAMPDSWTSSQLRGIAGFVRIPLLSDSNRSSDIELRSNVAERGTEGTHACGPESHCPPFPNRDYDEGEDKECDD